MGEHDGHSPWASPGYTPAAQPNPQSPPLGSPQRAQPAHPQQGSGHYTFPALQKPKLDPLAPASLLTSPIAPLGLALGISSLRRIRKNRLRGKGLATAGVILSSLFLAGGLLTLGTFALDGTISQMAQTPTPGDVPAARSLAPINLDVGNCVVTLPVSNEVGEVPLTPCADDHQYQVIDRVAVTGETYPGAEALFANARETCQSAFDAVTSDDATWPSSYRPWHLVPSEHNWNAGEHNIICLARSDAGPLTVDLVNGK